MITMTRSGSQIRGSAGLIDVIGSILCVTRASSSHRFVIQRPTGTRRVVLWPGVMLPVLGLLGAVGIGIAGLSLTLHPGAPNHSLGARWAFGEIMVAGAWALYKVGSQRIVLAEDEMRIYTWALCWRVPRGQVRDVQVRTREQLSLAVVLINGFQIRPTTFATRQGIGRGSGNALSRAGITGRILEWNAGVPAPASGSAPGPEGGDRRYSQLRRDDLVVLIGLSLVVALEAIIATSLGFW
jgi:hypothetical protein